MCHKVLFSSGFLHCSSPSMFPLSFQYRISFCLWLNFLFGQQSHFRRSLWSLPKMKYYIRSVLHFWDLFDIPCLLWSWLE
jgi:hypothetical protein